MERTFVMVKPDGVQRRLLGEVISRIERKGLSIIGLKLIVMSGEEARALYRVHEGKPFHPKLIRLVTSGPVAVMAVEGYRAIRTVRALLGKTFGYEAEPGTIRGDYALSRGKNIVHGSDGPESAARELGIFFREEELVRLEPVDREWVLEPDELEEG